VDHPLVPPSNGNHDVDVRIALEQPGEARHHPDAAAAAPAHLAQHDGAHQVVARRLP
jgi:hypothetical protein